MIVVKDTTMNMSLTSARGWRRLRDLLACCLLIATIAYLGTIVLTMSPYPERVAAAACASDPTLDICP